MSAARRSFVLGAAGLALGTLLAACGRKEGPRFQSTDITGAEFARDFTLKDHNGTTRTLADFRGKVVVVFFGYTHCPDVCPTTLIKLKAVMGLLGPDAAKVQMLLVSVDPERDTPEVLKVYTTGFDPTFLGLAGTREELERTTKEFRVIAQKQPGQTPETYTVDHSSALYAFDTTGKVRLYITGSATPEAMAADLRLLMAGA